jgi:hypothetical protein
MGLGPLHTVSLAEAREIARQARQLLLNGVDPVDAKSARIAKARIESIKAKTFQEAAREYIDSHDAGWRSAKHVREWTDTLARFVYPVFGDLPVKGDVTGNVAREAPARVDKLACAVALDAHDELAGVRVRVSERTGRDRMARPAHAIRTPNWGLGLLLWRKVAVSVPRPIG